MRGDTPHQVCCPGMVAEVHMEACGISGAPDSHPKECPCHPIIISNSVSTNRHISVFPDRAQHPYSTLTLTTTRHLTLECIVLSPRNSTNLHCDTVTTTVTVFLPSSSPSATYLESASHPNHYPLPHLRPRSHHTLIHICIFHPRDLL